MIIKRTVILITIILKIRIMITLVLIIKLIKNAKTEYFLSRKRIGLLKILFLT